MWNIDTPWFDVAVMMSIFAVGGVIFGRFEMHKPWWRRVLKQVAFVAGMVTITETLGRSWAYGFLGLLMCAAVAVHAWWLPKHGINGLTAEPYGRYLAFVTRRRADPREPLSSTFSEACRVALAQARDEGVAQQEDALDPAHLALGVIKTLEPPVRALLPVAPSQFECLYASLGSTPARAPASSADIVYTEAAKEVLAGARHATGNGRPVQPVHLLIGIHRPRNVADGATAIASPTAAALAAIGLNYDRLVAIAAEIAPEVAEPALVAHPSPARHAAAGRLAPRPWLPPSRSRGLSMRIRVPLAIRWRIPRFTRDKSRPPCDAP